MIPIRMVAYLKQYVVETVTTAMELLSLNI